jgi:hypothetical protein
MAEPKTSDVAQAYLAELRAALIGVSTDVRDGIVSGVQEELDGLDSADAALRIKELGDPNFIAAEARAESATSPGANQNPVRSTAWFDVIAALLLMVGGVVIPFVGWLAGVTMVWISRTWTRGEKWIATLVPFAPIAIVAVIHTISALFFTSDGGEPGGDVINPLFSALFDIGWSSILLVVVMQVPVGIWLLVRARQSRSRPRLWRFFSRL